MPNPTHSRWVYLSNKTSTLFLFLLTLDLTSIIISSSLLSFLLLPGRPSALWLSCHSSPHSPLGPCLQFPGSFPHNSNLLARCLLLSLSLRSLHLHCFPASCWMFLCRTEIHLSADREDRTRAATKGTKNTGTSNNVAATTGTAAGGNVVVDDTVTIKWVFPILLVPFNPNNHCSGLNMWFRVSGPKEAFISNTANAAATAATNATTTGNLGINVSFLFET